MRFMLHLQHLSLVQFKNYMNRSFDFEARITGICGNNGAGKTNLLDAIHYLCFTKSYFSRTESNNVSHGQTGFRLEGELVLKDKPEKAICILRENGRKEFLINDEPYSKFSQHIGRYPCVIIAPDDASLITGDSRERRSFLDSILCQLDPIYMRQLIEYKKILDQRNSLLRNMAETGERNLELLDIFDSQLLSPGEFIFNKRKEFVISFLPRVGHIYAEIAHVPEEISLVYETELMEAGFDELLSINRSKDLAAQRTCSGIHRDELDIQLNNHSFRSTASQGQRKSLLFALKLAELDILKKEKGFAPLLLLDDVFEKLDEERVGNLLEKVCRENEGQVFITDTHEERLRDHLKNVSTEFDLIAL